MNAVRHCFLHLGRQRFLCWYPGGVTLRLKSAVLILRWKSYVPEWVQGRRVRLGRVELHARRG